MIRSQEGAPDASAARARSDNTSRPVSLEQRTVPLLAAGSTSPYRSDTQHDARTHRSCPIRCPGWTRTAPPPNASLFDAFACFLVRVLP